MPKLKRRRGNLEHLTTAEMKLLKRVFGLVDMIEGFFTDIKRKAIYGKTFRRVNKLERRIFK